MPQPNWHMKHWNTGRKMTLAEAFGFSSFTLSFPKLQPQLPNVSAQAQQPFQVQGNVAPIAPKGVGKTPAPKGALPQYARKLMSMHGWTGKSQWADFVKLEVSEAGWNPRIFNNGCKTCGSGAFGIAQALGHAGPHGDGTGDISLTQGTLANEYGGYGLTNAEAKRANSGDGYMQLKWMMNYIKVRYGSPSNAWQFHVQNNSY